MAELALQGRVEALWLGARRRRRRSGDRARRVRGARGPLRLRQVDHSLRMISGLESVDGRAHPDRRSRRDGRGASAARGGDGVPVLRALSAYDGGAEHRLRAQARQGAQGRDRPARGRGRRDAADRGAARPLPARAFRRAAPARGHRALHHPRPAGLPLRRAALQPRRRAPRADAPRNRAAARSPSTPPWSTSPTTRPRP